MGSLTHVSVVLFFVSAYSSTSLSTQVSTNIPWSNLPTTENFLKTFLHALLISGKFSEEERENLEFISKSILSVVSQISTQSGHEVEKLRMLNGIFAASLAEIVVLEGGEQPVFEALNEAFLQTTGTVNTALISKIKTFIRVLSEEQQHDNDVDYEYPTLEGYPRFPAQTATTGSYGTAFPAPIATVASTSESSQASSTSESSQASYTSESSQASSTSASSSATTTMAAAEASAGASASALSTTYYQSLLWALLSNEQFSSVYNGFTSKAAARAFTASAVQAGAIAGGLPYGVALDLVNEVANAVEEVDIGGGAYAYANAVAYKLTQVLSSYGMIADNDIASYLSAAFSAAASNASAASAETATSTFFAPSSSATSHTSSSVAGSSGASGVSSVSSVGSSGSSTDVASSVFGEYGVLSQPVASSSPTLLSGLFSSAVGLPSPKAAERVSSLVPSLLSAISPSGLDKSLFSSEFASLVYQISQSAVDLSPSQILTEALLEFSTGLIQILSSAQVGEINASLATSTAVVQTLLRAIAS